MNDVFVANLNFTANESALFELFRLVASVSGVRIMRDSESGQSKGFGFVELQSPNDIQAACELDGSVFLGRTIRMQPAKPRGSK